MIHLKKTEQSPILGALSYLNNLYRRDADPFLGINQYLLDLRTAKTQNIHTFIHGVQSFTRIANFNPNERVAFYGNKFAGLHYNSDLVKLWNESSTEKIKSYELNHLHPPGWNYNNEDGMKSLIYRGNAPSVALDSLLQGPTVIDCGMFCQLSLWFGIRYMLGDESFNQLFGNTSFYLTQIIYSEIDNPEKPYNGNPLFPFLSNSISQEEQSVSVVHVSNNITYRFKHPGGNYGGENCIVINGAYTIFDPNLERKTSLNKADVENILLNSFNADQDINDIDNILFFSKNPDSIHPLLRMSYQSLVELAKLCAPSKLDAQSWKVEAKIADETTVVFDLDKFILWLSFMKENKHKRVSFTPLRKFQLRVGQEFIQQIPFENRNDMSFDTYKAESDLHRELLALSLRFCASVMKKESISLILTGKSGVGKTASAVSCAKELISRGKKVFWISELIVSRWVGKAESIKDFELYGTEIRRKLNENPDAVFIDDNNLTGYLGKVLLEETYLWYVTYPGKGLFITSNENISFDKAYGLKLNRKYYCPPFPGYTSSVYENTIVCHDLDGKSFRPSLVKNVMNISDHEKLMRLKQVFIEQSAGIIISKQAFEGEKKNLHSLEFIPHIDKDSLAEIRRSLQRKGVLGEAYSKLSEIQKKWLEQFTLSQHYPYDGRYPSAHLGLAVRNFEGTKHEIIALEIHIGERLFGPEKIDDDSMKYLLSIINFSHDTGGKKIILINCTDLTHEELLKKIKEEIPSAEKERAIARLDQLIFSSQLSEPASSITNAPVLHLRNKNHLIEKRHQSAEAQEMYDRQFGLVRYGS